MANNPQNPSLAALMEDLANKMASLIAKLKKEHQPELQALRCELRELRAQMVDVETASRLNLAKTWDELMAILLAHEAKSPSEGGSP
ncbi:hypothetical protein RHGRI_010579 [Rhododendron griersonianum]|uniref:DUF904 domain-containing protein n=1 Tax=Rhododendron griersonianum TaxID=479676 RepID=A0AAV6KJQ2_9ERIC|nr:hypothetical protein RHGRI_010579 [Rhododendron griersonianum]